MICEPCQLLVGFMWDRSMTGTFSSTRVKGIVWDCVVILPCSGPIWRLCIFMECETLWNTCGIQVGFEDACNWLEHTPTHSPLVSKNDTGHQVVVLNSCLVVALLSTVSVRAVPWCVILEVLRRSAGSLSNVASSFDTISDSPSRETSTFDTTYLTVNK